MGRRQTETVLENTHEALNMVLFGIHDITDVDPLRRAGGFRNVTVWGRAVTNVLQGLRTIYGPKFDLWYRPWAEEMQADPLLRFFYKLRSVTLKEGGPTTSFAITIRNLDPTLLPAPPSDMIPTDYFIADATGGTGWLEQVGEGQHRVHYVKLPPEIGEVSLQVENPPKEHLGMLIADRSALGLSRLYFDYLERLFWDASTTFSK